MEISTASKSTIGIPNVKLIANIHGNEAAGREILLHLIQLFVTNYTTDDTVRWLLNNTRIHILPSLNPDGFEASTEGQCEIGRGRENARFMDLNRNFPDYFQNNTKPRQYETQAMINWLSSNTFVLSASLHGGALVANYPYENVMENSMKQPFPASISPDDDVFRYLATVYSFTHPTMHLGYPCNKLDTGFPGGITNGAAWYTITGGMQDYNYIYHGCMEITLEMSCCKYPLTKNLPKLWNDNKEALLKYISQVHQGVHGILLDNSTRQGIPRASINIIGRDSYFRSSDRGEFWRILLPGTYEIQVHAAGYSPQIVEFTVSSKKEGKYLTPTWLIIYMPPVLRLPKVVSDQVQFPTNPPNLLKNDEASTMHNSVTENTVGLTEDHMLAYNRSTLFKEITPTSMNLENISNLLQSENKQLKTLGSGWY